LEQFEQTSLTWIVFGLSSVDDVYAVSDKLEKAGCSFKKKPDEGRMKGLAFVYDPDGYWVEIVRRGDNSGIQNEMNFSQTMLRVKDPKKSLEFYQAMGMKLLEEKHFDDFSLFFLGSSCVPDGASRNTMFSPVLELTHNHGTEANDEFRHFNGNEEGRQGFGHIGFLVDDVYAACDKIRDFGYGFRKEPDGGAMKGLAFCYDPDGYSVEIIKRHLGPDSPCIDFGDVKVQTK
jgi:lactoylglutathione lyase